MKLSLRLRLTIWYSAIVAVSLLGFGVLNYITASQELYENLDSSILQVAGSLDYIIEEKQRETKFALLPATARRSRSGSARRKNDRNEREEDRFALFRQDSIRNFIGPLRPQVDTSDVENEVDAVWSAVYQRILLDPKNYFIQVADTNNTIVWRSDRLQSDSLPMARATQDFTDSASTIVHFDDIPLGDENLRVLLYSTPLLQISVGYPVKEIENTLNDLFSSLIIALPGVLLISMLGGLFLAKYSLQPIEDITRSAQEITASNLSKRLPAPVVNDEIARLTETLNEMISRLEASFLQIRQFTGDASHELRTPLAILMGELEIGLRSRKTPEEYEEIISSAIEEVIRLNKVVNNLLKLSRADSGQLQMKLEQLNLSEFLHDIYEDAMVLSEERGIVVSFSAAPNVYIQGDKVHLHQAFLNLVDNAVKYTPENGEVFIAIKEEGPFALISVRDTGIGIPQEDLKNIFHRFYRVDKARSQDVRGHGLGLAIVKWIIETHQGTIHIESEVGRGSTFYVRLPTISTTAHSQPASRSAVH